VTDERRISEAVRAAPPPHRFGKAILAWPPLLAAVDDDVACLLL
jgi:hypothetical protein